MASRYWTDGAGDGDTTNVNNWSATRGGASGASVPGNSDIAYFYDGDRDLIANAAFAALTVYFGGNFVGGVNGLQSNFASAVWTVQSQAAGKTFSVGPAVGVTMAAIHVKKASGTVSIVGGAGTVTLLSVGKEVGRLNVDATCAVTTYNNAGCPDYIGYNATAITTGQWDGGGVNHVCCRTITTGTINGPTTLNVKYAGASPTSTTFTINGGSTLLWDSDGTITTSNVKAGGRLAPVSVLFAVTTMNLWEGGDGSVGSDKLTIGTLNKLGNAA